MVRNLLVATVLVAVISVFASPVSAQYGSGNSANNVFSQYYTQPGASTVESGMYPAPHYVPQNVGHTYYTYQPLMPHEMMYQHTRNYYNYYNTGGYYGGYDALNKTQVRWQSGSNHMGPIPFSAPSLQSLQWRYNKKRYCLGGNCGSGYGISYGCASGDCGDSGYGDYGYGDSGYGGESYGGCADGNCGAQRPGLSIQR